MSTVAAKPVIEAPSVAEVVVRAGRGARVAAKQHLLLSWSISRDAAAAAGLCGPGPGTVELRVRVAWNREVDGLGVVVADGDRVRELEVAGKAEWVRDDEHGMLHLELPGVLRVSAREQPLTVLFARTALLGALGLGGGRYEFERAVVVDSE